MASAASYGSLPFAQQIEFFRRKAPLPTQSWTDLVHEQHDRAFVVAGANRDDLVIDFQAAVDKAIADGGTLEDFRKDFDRIVAKYGWDYNGGRNWRSRVIYETNMRTSYAAGRWAQLQAVKADRPFWQYVHSDAVQTPRPSHLAWNGLVLSADDPWWLTHYPPNDWGCQCSVRALNQRDLTRLGKTGPDQAPPVVLQTVTIGGKGPNPRTVEVPEGVGPGWGYAPGRAWAERLSPTLEAEPQLRVTAQRLHEATIGPIAPMRPTPPIDAGADPAAQVDAFLERFGATRDRPAVYLDPTGAPVVVAEEMLQSDIALPAPLPLLAATLRDADEIWLFWLPVADVAGVVTQQLRRRYLRQVLLPGATAPSYLVVDVGRGTWSVLAGDLSAIEQVRIGQRLWAQGAGN